jgi:hypothetical protein
LRLAMILLLFTSPSGRFRGQGYHLSDCPNFWGWLCIEPQTISDPSIAH